MKFSFLDQLKSSPMIAFAAAFMLGIPFAKWAKVPLEYYVLLAALFFILALVFWTLNAYQKLALVIIPLFFIYGAIRFEVDNQPLPTDHISFFHNDQRHVYLTGYVSEMPDIRDNVMNIKVSATDIDLGYGNQPASGMVLVKLYREQSVGYGDKIRVYGVLDQPPEGNEFSYREYLLNKGITTMLTANNATMLPGRSTTFMGSFTNITRWAIFKRVEQLYSPPGSYLISGILVGLDKQIPPTTDQAFVDTGTSHIIAISGFNISIIAVILITMFTRLLGKRWGTILAIIGIGLYTMVAGADAPVVRAAVMGGLGALGVLLHRRNATLTLLFIAGMLMAFFTPNVIYEPGFQLSFAATLGIISIVPPLEDRARAFFSRFVSDERVEIVMTVFSDLFLITFAAQITTLPIILAHFGKLSLVTFLANPLILPLQPPLLILSGISVVASILWMPLGTFFATITAPFAFLTIWVVERLAPYAGPSLHFNADNIQFVILYYAALVFYPQIAKRTKDWYRPVKILPAVLLVIFLIWQQVYRMPDGKTHILIPSIGASDAILITTPSGEHVLINGGDRSSVLLDKLGRVISPYNKKIDLLIVANTQENNLSALPNAISLYPPDEVLWSGNREASYSSQRLFSAINQKHIPVTFVEDGWEYDLGDGLILSVDNVNERGAVYNLRQGGFSLLLPMGVNRKAIEELTDKEAESVTAYYLSENGYPPSNPQTLIDSYPAEMYILSFGFDNFAILPSQEMLDGLNSNNIFRTDENGWIEIVSDGQEYQVRTQYGLR